MTGDGTENAATYGVCMTCGAPREAREVETFNKRWFARPDGEPEYHVTREIVCPVCDPLLRVPETP